jgi:flagellar motor switch protein FliG
MHKVAILLTLLGRETAQAIIKQFTPDDVERLGKEMAKCKEISQEEGEQVAQDFIHSMAENKFPFHGGMDFVEEVLAPIMDPDRAQRMIRKIQSPRQIIPFENLHEVSPEVLIQALKNEHPQTIALVVSNLPSELSARLLKNLGEAQRYEVARRVALLDQSEPDLETVREIEARLNERIKKEEEKPEMSKSGGAQACADILNLMDKDLVHNIMATLEQKDQDLASAVKMKMVRFDDLLKLTDMEIQRILKEVETQELATSCVKADPAIAEAVFRNMSQRGAEMLKDDIEVMQNTKPEAIRAARLKIAETMRRLDEEGAIVLNKRSLDDELV